MDKFKFDRLREIMSDYQEDFEQKQKAHPFVQAYNQCENDTTKILQSLDVAIHEQVYAALDMGFVEGVSFAMDVMDITDSGNNHELLEQFLLIMKSGSDDSQTCYNSTI